MGYKIIEGDCIENMRKLINDGVKVDLTVTSPPYDQLRGYSGTLSWDFEKFKEVANLLYGERIFSGAFRQATVALHFVTRLFAWKGRNGKRS